MTFYHCYFLLADGHFRSRESFEVVADREAITLAKKLYAEQQWHSGFELWTEARMVHKEEAATPNAA